MPIALDDDLIPLSQARRLKPLLNPRTGRPRDLKAAYRWAQRGVRGVSGHRVILETVRTTSGIMTTADAVDRFVAAMNDRNFAGGVAESRSPARRQRDYQRAVGELAEAGW